MFGVYFCKRRVHLMGHRGVDGVDKSFGHVENATCCTSDNWRIGPGYFDDSRYNR
jgi:hypothetical protein